MKPSPKYKNPPPDAESKPVAVEVVDLNGQHDWSASAHDGIDLIPFGQTRTVTLDATKTQQDAECKPDSA